MVSSGGRLDALQLRVLETLADVEPRFVLSGGAALAGIYLGHRTTRDLDLFWRNRAQLGGLAAIVEQRLARAGLSVAAIQTTPAFVRFQVSDGTSAVVVDLISEPTDAIDTAETHYLGRAAILVDSPRAILAEKLCALLERSELRDLIDVEALMKSGERLDVAIADAPQRDGGFSSLTLAWLLEDFDVIALAKATGLDDAQAVDLDVFRQELIDRLINPVR